MAIRIYFLLVFPLLTKQSELTENCKKLKCPYQEDSTCVKVTYKKGLKNTAFNVIVFNECEIGYIKCHPGLKAFVVPMRNCHTNNVTSIKRWSRAIKEGVHRVGQKRVYLYGDNLSDSSSDEAKTNAKKDITHKNIKKIKLNHKNKIKNIHEYIGNDNKTNDADTPRMDSAEALIELNSRSREKHVNTPNEERDDKTHDKEGEEEDPILDENQDPRDELNVNDSVGAVESGDGNIPNNEEKEIEKNSNEKKPFIDDKVDKDYEHSVETNGNIEEDNKDCPATCALRDMMVCARCNHGVYRTFMSVCHLRAFTCTHSDEKLSLVSRRPCIQSAPFLSDLPPLQGRVLEPSDSDRVLQFIQCRAEGKLNGGDPKCNFKR